MTPTTQRAAAPNLIGRNIALRQHIDPQELRELCGVNAISLLLCVSDPPCFQGVNEHHVVVLVKRIVAREVVAGGFERGFTSCILLSDAIEVRILDANLINNRSLLIDNGYSLNSSLLEVMTGRDERPSNTHADDR